MIVRLFALTLCLLPASLMAQDRLVRLYAPPGLVETGLMKYALPRFSLKTRVKVELVQDPAAAQVLLDRSGTALFEGAGQVWHMDAPGAGHEGTDKLAAWLTSEVGRRTVLSFAPGGTPLFTEPQAQVAEVVAVEITGDAEIGHKVARGMCTRCHAVDEATRGWGIGSTPSFGVLRALPDWEERFGAFFVLNPHPAFTQVEDVTEPFPVERPSPIEPIRLTLDELEALMAYVSTMPAADLGAPLQSQ